MLEGVSVAGLFPALDLTGGIEMSGRLAWDAITSSGVSDARLLCFGDAHPGAVGTKVVSARSKAAVVRAALGLGGDPDVVLIWHIGMLKTLPFLKGSGTATVVQFLHGREVWKSQDRLTKRLLGRVHLFLSNSDHTWGRFLVHNPGLAGARHRTVNLGSGEPLAGAVRPSDPPAALMLGRLSEGVTYKGHREVISSWPKVRDAIPEAELWIAGDGPERETLEAHAAHVPGVSFLGRVSEEEKLDRLQRSRCLALPSTGEGFGLVYLEAMRAGRPCLVGDSDAGREIVDVPAAGLAADPSDAVALTEALVGLMTPGPDWDAMSRRAEERYRSRFTASHFAERIVDASPPRLTYKDGYLVSQKGRDRCVIS